MSQTTFDEDELFDEASEEMQADVDNALARAREQIPGEETVLTADDGDLLAVLDSLTTTLDVEEIETALQGAQKAFVIGQRAEAFDDDFINDTEATIATLEETTDTLRTIDTAATSLAEALTAFQDRDALDAGATENDDTLAEEPDETPSEDDETAQTESDAETTDEGEPADLTDTADTDE